MENVQFGLIQKNLYRQIGVYYTTLKLIHLPLVHAFNYFKT